MKIRKIAFFLLLAFLAVGCATPKAVKDLSYELVEVNVKYHETLKAYFAVIEKFVDSQIQLAKILIEDLDETIVAELKENAKEDLKEEKANVNKILREFEEAISKNTETSQTRLNKLVKLGAELKAKNKELLSIQSTIIEAQRKLDKYVHMEKADEALANELMGIVSGQMDKITSVMGEVSVISDQMSNVTKNTNK